MSETRYAQLKNINPTEAEKLLAKIKRKLKEDIRVIKDIYQ